MALLSTPSKGDRFNSLTFVEISPHRQNGNVMWVMTCDCGNTKEFLGANVRRGNTKSCCGTKSKNLVGQRFGRLIVLTRKTDGLVSLALEGHSQPSKSESFTHYSVVAAPVVA